MRHSIAALLTWTVLAAGGLAAATPNASFPPWFCSTFPMLCGWR